MLYWLAGLPALALGVHVWRKTFYHFAVADPGRLYRAGTLPPVGLELACRVFRIDTVINLRSEGENAQPWHARQRRICERLGVELVDLPMPWDTPPTQAQLERFLALAGDPERRCLVHCEMGIIRTGMMVLAYRARVQGMAPEDPWALVPGFGHDVRRRCRPDFQAFVEGFRART